MKKEFLVSIALIFSSALIAQTGKGKFVLSGSTGLQFISSNVEMVYDGQSQGDIAQSSFSFKPSVGYFVIDNLELGLSTDFSRTTQKDLGDKFTQNSTIVIPYVGYYFPIEGSIRPLVQVGAGVMTTSQEFKEKGGASEEDRFSGLALSVGGGFAYFIKEVVSLNFGVSYTNAALKNSEDSDLVQKSGHFGANIGLSVYL